MEQASVLGTLFPFIIFGLIFYFLLIRPQQKQAKAHALMLSQLQKGDKIVTAGGLKCTVVQPNDDFIKVSLNDNTIVEVAKTSVARKIERLEEPAKVEKNSKKQEKKKNA
ncbi:preprotein translocase subunit YajC [Campylobacter ureolyticus]|uniref:preprotein translocase subunit YajC n=1 Tax=Campylobacter ureolyticus TaxID=827 RepID=UPI0022B3DC76|nr:preprotein translocase subunit YajC [Campylobacter ureolyticus]MCZ6157495.1 preprotein translocase subunit YajC [Campylobacter ureolyticus]